MAIRIPQNQIQYKYTIGKEYMYKDTYREYQGYYYELNNQLFAGKEFNSNAPILVPIPITTGNNNFLGFNSLLTNAATYVYGKIAKEKLPNNFNPSSYIFQPKFSSVNSRFTNRYFIQKINTDPNNISIKEIDEDSYTKIQTNPLFKSVKIIWDTIGDNTNEINKANQTIIGIKEFLQDLNYSTNFEDDGNEEIYTRGE